MEQPQYNMFKRDKVEGEYARLYNEIGLGTTIWSPLASGLLTGKYNDGIPEDSRLAMENYDWLREKLLETESGKSKLKKVEKLATVADEAEISMPELGLAWCLKNPNVSTVITGASKPEQVRQNMKAIDKLEKLTKNVMQKIEEILDNNPKEEPDFRR